MNKIAHIIVVIIIIFSTMTWAQEEKKTELYFNTGLSFPAQYREFSKNFSLGYNFGSGLGYEFYQGLTLSLNFDYNKFFYQEDTPTEDNSIHIFSISGNLKVALITQSTSPSFYRFNYYLISGIGFSRFATSTKSTQLVGFETQSTFAILLGAGFDAPVTETSSLFLESKFGMNIAKGKNVNYIPLKIGVKWKL